MIYVLRWAGLAAAAAGRKTIIEMIHLPFIVCFVCVYMLYASSRVDIVHDKRICTAAKGCIKALRASIRMLRPNYIFKCAFRVPAEMPY